MLEEIAKLVQLCALELPPELFAGVPRIVIVYTVITHELTEFLKCFPNYPRVRLAQLTKRLSFQLKVHTFFLTLLSAWRDGTV